MNELELYDESYLVSQNMQKYGGSFASSLGVALSHADVINISRIKMAFPELWDEYLKFNK